LDVRVNGVAQEIPGPWASVPEFVAAFYACGRFPGEMITAIHVGGAAAALDDAVRRLDGPVAPIEVATMPGLEVLLDAAAAIRTELGDLSRMLRDGAGKYRLATEAQAHTTFLDCVERLGKAAHIARNLVVLGNITDLGYPVDGLVPDEPALEAVMGEMIASQEQSDWMMLADLMEYELAPLLDHWRERLEAAVGSIEAASLPA
jgi:hypothetical protein